MTTKGELVRAILFPPPLDLAFYDDFLKSVRVFLALGLIGMAYSLYMWISLGVRDTEKRLVLTIFVFREHLESACSTVWTSSLLLSTLCCLPPSQPTTLSHRKGSRRKEFIAYTPSTSISAVE